MALIDVIKYNGNNSDFVWKFPSEDLKLGAQLTVGNGQTAFFVKNGQILDEFSEGRYTLKTANIPLLNKLINLPFGGNSPFSAEVWFVNRISKLDNKWGTQKPINLEDPVYGVVVPVRAFGQYGFKISSPEQFLKTIIGTIQAFNASQITEYFTGRVLSLISTIVSRKIVLEKISLLQIPVFLEELSEATKNGLQEEFNKYGIEILNFYYNSINIPENDPSLKKLKEAKELSMKVNTVGKDIYQMDRSFDVMDKAAENEGNAGSLLNAGVGLGAGLGLGNTLGNSFGQVGGNMNTNPSPPPVPNKVLYHFVINDEQSNAYSMSDIPSLIASGTINKETLAWKNGLDNWTPCSELDDLKNLFGNTPPPIPKKS
ncbi:MAG: SPFH domain-containing protein [Cyclobacteriaceae bacterium]